MSSAASRPQQTANQMTSHMVSQTAVSQTAVSPSATALSAAGPATNVPASGQAGSASNSSSSGGSSGSASGNSKPSSKQLRKPPSRPQLMGPPARPKPPVSAPEPTPAAIKAPESEAPAEPQPLGPIPIPSERMQYRAIGLLKGKYVASEEQFNRGDIVLTDGTPIDAVLLGRVTSLIKKHVDLETEHLWVVYPRTLYKDENEPALHMQIVGVWEPETLNARKEEEEGIEKPPILSSADAEEKHCDRFSIRGEIAKYSEDDKEIVVNIVQKSKSETAKPKRPFKLLISGTLTGRTTGYFWDFEVKREGTQLILVSAKSIAVVPPKKKSKDEKKRTNSRRPAPSKPRSTPVPKPKPKAKGTAPSTAPSSEADKSADQPESIESTPESASKEQPATPQPVKTAAVETTAVKTTAVETLPAAEIADVPAAE